MTNEMIKMTWDKVVEGYDKAYFLERVCDFGQLNHCQAWMHGISLDGKQYVVLTSYSTIVAIWDTEEGIVIDALRAVYGYTNTSAQHISKFTKWIDSNYPHSKPEVYRVYTWDKIGKVR